MVTVRYLWLNTVKVTDTMVKIRKGLISINIPREAILGVEIRPVTGKVVFLTAKRRYKVVTWHGYRKIKRELGYL